MQTAKTKQVDKNKNKTIAYIKQDRLYIIIMTITIFTQSYKQNYKTYQTKGKASYVRSDRGREGIPKLWSLANYSKLALSSSTNDQV